MSEFRSNLEDLIEAIELNFSATPGFGPYKRFLSHSIAHPAKMNTRLLSYLISKFTRENDVVLNPMAGSYSTCIISSLLGRNSIGVDLEDKFYEWGLEAKRKVLRQQTLTSKGRITVLKGDSRRLSELLRGQTDIIVTSPPYSEQQAPHRGGGNIGFIRPSKDGKIGTDEKDKCWFVSENPNNIANLRHGSIDAIVTSPPYSSEAIDNRKSFNKTWQGIGRENGKRRGGALIRERYEEQGNIANLRHGKIDVVVTSPPYEGFYLGGGDSEKREKRLIEAGHDPKEFLGGKARNVTLKHYHEVDAVITSPPYEDSIRSGREGSPRFDEMMSNKFSMEDTAKAITLGYSKSENNIGNLKKETYLEAMLQVYREMWKVLKTDGLAIIVIKPFIRNKKVVDLPYHTWLLLKQAGFKLKSLLKLRLKNVSFWRILYRKKYPQVEKIKHEYVLVVKK